VMSQVSTTSSENNSGCNTFINNRQFDRDSLGYGGPTMVSDPPSVAMSDSMSVREGYAGVGMMTKDMNSQVGRRGKGAGFSGSGKESGASSESANGVDSRVLPLSLATLTHRAQKAVAARLEMASTVVASSVQKEERRGDRFQDV
jgi:hypothetical protein